MLRFSSVRLESGNWTEADTALAEAYGGIQSSFASSAVGPRERQRNRDT